MHDIRELRRMAGWTQSRTSRASGINRAKLSQVECLEIELTKKEEAAIRNVLLAVIRERALRIESVLASSNSELAHASSEV